MDIKTSFPLLCCRKALENTHNVERNRNCNLSWCLSSIGSTSSTAWWTRVVLRDGLLGSRQPRKRGGWLRTRRSSQRPASKNPTVVRRHQTAASHQTPKDSWETRNQWHNEGLWSRQQRLCWGGSIRTTLDGNTIQTHTHTITHTHRRGNNLIWKVKSSETVQGKSAFLMSVGNKTQPVRRWVRRAEAQNTTVLISSSWGGWVRDAGLQKQPFPSLPHPYIRKSTFLHALHLCLVAISTCTEEEKARKRGQLKDLDTAADWGGGGGVEGCCCKR